MKQKGSLGLHSKGGLDIRGKDRKIEGNGEVGKWGEESKGNG